MHTFLKKDVSVDLSTPEEFEDRVIDFSDIQELLKSVSFSPSKSIRIPQTNSRLSWKQVTLFPRRYAFNA